MRSLACAKLLVIFCLTACCGSFCFAKKQRLEFDPVRVALRESKALEKSARKQAKHNSATRKIQLRTPDMTKGVSFREVREQKTQAEKQAVVQLANLARQREKARVARRETQDPPSSYAEEARQLKWRNEGKAGFAARCGHELCLKTLDWSEAISNAICPNWWWQSLRQFIGLTVLIVGVVLVSYLVLGLLVVRYDFPGKKRVYVLSGIPAVMTIVSSEVILTEGQASALHIVLAAMIFLSVCVAMNIPLRHLDSTKQSFIISLFCHVLFSLGVFVAGTVITAAAIQLLMVAILVLIVAVMWIAGAGAAAGSIKEEEERRIKEANSDVRIANDGEEVFRVGQSLWQSRDGVYYRGGENGQPPYKDFAER